MANKPAPVQFSNFTKADFDDPNMGYFNTVMQQFANAINAGNGSAGKTALPAGIDMQGATVSGVGEPQSPTDAISKGHAEKNYSAQALAPQLEAGTKTGPGLKTYRALNSKTQQESYSTFLNGVTNTAPTTNTSIVSAGAPSGGSVTFTISAGFHLYVDGSIVPYGTFSDTVPLPSSQAITSMTRTSGVVTATGVFTGLSAGESIYELGALDSSFDGTFELISASGTTLTWAQPGFADGTTTGGAASTGGCYYVYLKNPSHTLAVSGPFSSDSQQNRLAANVDGQVLIAVVVINAGGVVTTQSAAGATVPAAQNKGNRIVARL